MASISASSSGVKRALLGSLRHPSRAWLIWASLRFCSRSERAKFLMRAARSQTRRSFSKRSRLPAAVFPMDALILRKYSISAFETAPLVSWMRAMTRFPRSAVIFSIWAVFCSSATPKLVRASRMGMVLSTIQPDGVPCRRKAMVSSISPILNGASRPASRELVRSATVSMVKTSLTGSSTVLPLCEARGPRAISTHWVPSHSCVTVSRLSVRVRVVGASGASGTN